MFSLLVCSELEFEFEVGTIFPTMQLPRLSGDADLLASNLELESPPYGETSSLDYHSTELFG